MVATMFEIGKLYKCTEYYLLLYPTKEVIGFSSLPPTTARSTQEYASLSAEYWSEQLNCKVRFINSNDIFMCLKLVRLKPGKEIMQILYKEFAGWIRVEDWLDIKRSGVNF